MLIFILKRKRDILSVFFYLKFIYFQKILTQIQHYFLLNNKVNNYINLTILIFRIILLSHIFACIWYYIGFSLSDSMESTWLNKYNLINESVLYKYSYSFYFIIVTMNTVGYGF